MMKKDFGDFCSRLVRYRVEFFFGSAMAGIAIGETFQISFFVWAIAGVFAAGVYWRYRKKSLIAIAVLCVCATILGGVRAEMARSSPRPIGTEHPFAASLRRVVSRALEQGFSRPESDVLSGVLVGGQGLMPASIKQAFRVSGLSHILAVSGQNISLMLFFLGTALSGIGIPRKKRIYALIMASGAYAMVTGLGAPVIRAAIMGSCAVIASHLGRTSSALRALLLSASVMVFASPSILLSDLSFQLSFFATAGLVLLTRPIDSFLALAVRSETARSLFSQTLAAIIATQPLILATFGTLSLVAPFANVFATPLVPLVMAFGAAWGGVALAEAALHALVGTLPFLLSPFAAMPAWGAVHLLIGVARFFSGILFAQVTVAGGFPLAIAIGISLCLLFFLLVQSKKGARNA